MFFPKMVGCMTCPPMVRQAALFSLQSTRERLGGSVSWTLCTGIFHLTNLTSCCCCCVSYASHTINIHSNQILVACLLERSCICYPSHLIQDFRGSAPLWVHKDIKRPPICNTFIMWDQSSWSYTFLRFLLTIWDAAEQSSSLGVPENLV